MRLPEGPLSSRLVAERVGGLHRGPERVLSGVATVEDAGPEHLAFAEAAPWGEAGCLLVREALPGRCCVVVPSPRLAFATLLTSCFPEPRPVGVHPSAVVLGALGRDVAIGAHCAVGQGAVIGDGCVLHAGVVVGDGCVLGEGCVLFPRVVLYPGVVLGRRCRVHAGAVLGADGFSFTAGPTGPVRLPQLGRVVLEDDVEIGANTCVDRAFLAETRIGRGAKLDNLVQVGHNARIGEGSLLAAQCGLAGSVSLGRGVQVGGQAGLIEHVRVGDGARVGAGSGVVRDVQAGHTVLGSPALPIAKTRRLWALMKDLPERLLALERRP